MQGSNPDGQGHHVGTRVQHKSSPSFTPFGIVAKRLGFREMVKTHGHVSHCLPLVNNKLKVDCAILCCGQLLEFTRTSAFVRVCVSRSDASDAHDFFAVCFIGCRQSMRKRRATATRQLQHNTSLRKFFVLGALVPAMLLATRWVRHPIDDGWGGQSDHSGKTAFALVTFSDVLILSTHLLSSFQHIVVFECHAISFQCCLQLCLFQQHLIMRYFTELFECGAN